jgi:hypothetical protein
MDDIILMQVRYPLKSLREEPKGLGLRKGGFCVLMVEEVPVLGIFHNHIDLSIFEKCVPQFDDVGVVDIGVDGYLPLEQLEFGL